jgi:tetratricopeptide (TPR) repeat protein
MARGLAGYLQGRLTPALADLEKALDILSKRCPGAVWEIVTTRRFFVASLFFLGHWRRLSEVVPGFLAEAEGTGNLYASMCYRTAYSWATWIVRDAVSEGRRELDRAREEWKAERFQLCHCNILIGECYLDLYEARSERALVRLETQWPLVRGAQLLRIGVLEVQMLQLRAALLVDAADDLAAEGDLRKARRLRRQARRWSKRLSTRRIGRAAPLGQLLYAALEVGIGNRATALEHLRSALSGFEREDMLLFAAAARARLGQLVGGHEGAALLAEAGRTFDREGIVRRERVMQILAPGFRGVATSERGSAQAG